jgi:3',5'-cyclic AMP phosphodiesterase CpdA
LSPRPDLVVISGDIANPKLPEEYEHAKTLLGPAGEQAVSLEFEPRWPEVFKIEPQGSTCTRGSPARDSEAWSPMVCQPPNFLVLILMAMPIRRRRTYNGLF